MIYFLVLNGSGPYSVAIERTQPSGGITTEAGATSVPLTGQVDAVAPPAGVGYGMQPCPKP